MITDKEMCTIALYMVDDVREAVHGSIAPCTNEEFIIAYLTALNLVGGYEDDFGTVFDENDFIEMLDKEFRISWIDCIDVTGFGDTLKAIAAGKEAAEYIWEKAKNA